MSRRPVLSLVGADHPEALAELLAEGPGLREVSLAEAHVMVPALRPGAAIAAVVEDDAFDMDVAALHQGFLRQVRARGGVLALRSRAGRIERKAGIWQVSVTGGAVFQARILVDAAGAWGDEVAVAAGVAPLGLQPKRRTIAIVDPAPWQPANWPMVMGHNWYGRAEARTKFLVSPVDETPMPPHDVRPDEIDIAIAIDRMQHDLDIAVTRVEHSWAGLRTFTPDGSLAFGWDDAVAGFFWCVGQGGYGIQTSPSAGCLVADVISGRDPGAAGEILAAIAPSRFRQAGATAINP